ncbi:fimbria/pilus periplasmic chaperone [Escherichia coli]|nr:fimbria/pilus periplasmic chaperone [Escherichia coli]
MKKHLLPLALLFSGISPAQALDVGDISSFMNSDSSTLSKTIKNSTDSGRLINIRLERLSSPLDDGQVISMDKPDELLLTPASLLLPAQASEVIRFFYKGPADEKERYYRVSFREVPTRNQTRRSPTGGEVSTDPVVVMDTILVVRPRQVQFKWSFDKVTGTVSNTGNTWFKLLIKPGCDSTEEEGDAWYLRPGDVVHQPELRQPGNHYLVYNDKFIKISDSCPAKPPSAD